jgi:hypothetical protein
VPASTPAGPWTVSVFEFNTIGDGSGVGQFSVGTAPGGCPSPGVTRFETHEILQVVKYSIQKTCDAGLTGDAVFEPTVTIDPSTTIEFPAMKLQCNAAPAHFEAVPFGASIKLHEASPPAGTVAAADLTVGPGSNTSIVIHNAKASAGLSAPPARSLAATGGSPLWPAALLIVGMVLVAAGALSVRRQSRR